MFQGCTAHYLIPDGAGGYTHQPEAAPSGACDCQTDCWSLCENSLGGSG